MQLECFAILIPMSVWDVFCAIDRDNNFISKSTMAFQGYRHGGRDRRVHPFLHTSIDHIL